MAVSAPKTAGTFVVVVARTKPSSLARSTARLGQSLSRALSSPPLLPERRLRYFRPASRGPSEREGLASAAKIPLLGSHLRTSGRRRFYYDLEGAPSKPSGKFRQLTNERTGPASPIGRQP